MREEQVSQDEEVSVGDFYEGVLLETCRDENRSITRPRVRPLEYFPDWMRVEFPRDLREKYAIGTRFRADVTVGQKHWSHGALKRGRLIWPPDVIYCARNRLFAKNKADGCKEAGYD